MRHSGRETISATGSSVALTGLEAGKTYHFRLFDYNQNANTGNHALYLLGGSAQDSTTTSSSTGIADLLHAGIRFYPNPASDYLHIDLDAAAQCDRIQIRNMHGQVVRSIPVSGTNLRLPTGDLPAQVYMISFYRRNAQIGTARLLKR